MGDLGNFRILALEGECGGSSCYLEPRNLCQRVDDLLCQSVAEVLLLFVAAHVGEGQHGYGWLTLGARSQDPFQCRFQVCDGLKSIGWAPRHAPSDNLLERRRGLKCWRIVPQDTAQDLCCRVSGERARS